MSDGDVRMMNAMTGCLLIILSCLTCATATARNNDSSTLDSLPPSDSNNTQSAGGNQNEVDQMIEQAGVFVSKGDTAGSIAALTKAIEKNPKCDRAYYLRGKVYSDIVDDDEKAVPDFQEAARLMPSMSRYWTSLGNSLYYVNRYREAVKALDRALETSDAELTAVKLKYGGAINGYVLELKLHQYQGTILRRKALCYEELGDRELEKVDKKEHYYMKMANTYYSMHKFAESIPFFDKAVQFSKSNTLRYYRGLALIKVGRKSEGDKDIQIALDNGYKHPQKSKNHR